MPRFTHALLVALVSLVAALTLAGTASTSASEGLRRLPEFENDLLGALNQLRVDEGLRPLRVAPGLEAAAVAHSQAMLDGGFFAHDSRDGTPFHERVRRFYPSRGWSSWSVAENLLMNVVEIPVDQAMEAWLDSPGHREIMLMPAWREVGIGALHAPVVGGEWDGGPAWVVTMDFGARAGQPEVRKPSGRKPAPSSKPKQPKPKPAPVLPSVPPPAADAPADAVPNELYELDPHRLLLTDEG